MALHQIPSAFGRFARAYVRRRHTVLFFSLLLSLAFIPALSALHLNSRLLETFLLLNIVLAATGAEKSGRIRLLIVVGLVFALRFVGLISDSKQVSEGTGFALAALTLFAVIGSFRFAMRSRAVDSEHLYAALGAYLLAGQFFGMLAATLEQSSPGSYVGASLKEPGTFPISQAIYFSFVTLATLGYGDIVPANDLARGIAVVEAVAGQLYIAVLVSRLVGAYTSTSKQP